MARVYRDEASKTTRATLLLPDSTIHVVRGQSGWEITDRDDHGLGVVPAVLCLHRRRAGRWVGRSEMSDVIPLTDAIARMVTNMGVGAEAHALPSLRDHGCGPSRTLSTATASRSPSGSHT